MKLKWFSYSHDTGFELHETEEMAKLVAQMTPLEAYNTWITSPPYEIPHHKTCEYSKDDIEVKDHWCDCIEKTAFLAGYKVAEKQHAELVKLLEDVYGNINPIRGYADELEEDVRKAIDRYKARS